MAKLKYTVIKSTKQYKEYSNILDDLVSLEVQTKASIDEIELLTLLLEKWESERKTQNRNYFDDPIALLRSLMQERNLRAKDLVEILGVSKGLVSDILNHKKGLSKQNIRILSNYFKVDIALLYSYRV